MYRRLDSLEFQDNVRACMMQSSVQAEVSYQPAHRISVSRPKLSMTGTCALST